jgi:CRP/FNR family transcriptional regulator, cyclic AMP receptor protein
VTDRQITPLLELDPDLGLLLAEDRLQAAERELRVVVHALDAGPWDAGRLSGASPDHVGMLVLDGVLAREVLVSDTVSTELLGPGDVVRPWRDRDDASLLTIEIRWTVLADVRLAVLDRRFAARLARFPEVNAALLDRLTDRAQRMAVSQAISQLNGVDRRLLALFWHLAERWGRMTGQGVTVPLALSHRVLAQLVGARRPTVSTALAELAERGDLTRRDDGTWLLAGDSIGLPTPEVERVIQHRRRLLPPEPRPPADRPAASRAPLRWSAQRDRDELRLTLDRLREAVELESERLHDSRRLASELCRQAGELRERRPPENADSAAA